MVTGNTYRHPAVVAHMAATVDVTSNGRLNIGLGAGWNEYEHQSMGIPLYAPGERVRRLGEAVQIIKQLLTQPLTNFDGRYYQLQEARLAPKPIQKPHPPIVVGGSGEQLTLRIVAEHADFWNYQGRSLEEFVQKIEVLHRHCAEVGRDLASLPLSVQLRVDYDDLQAYTSLIQGYVDAGATILVMNLRYPYPDDIIARLAGEVIPKIHAR
jgi:alkanesulfonate monooxygenase SsuD/methylene tetrahydromethanopterin reductase-like flavin-dependent oxidoreductase (luciferase family)